MCGKDDTRPMPTQLVGYTIAIGLGSLVASRDSERSHPRYSRCPSSTCAHLEKYLLHFHILPDLTDLTALCHRAPVRKITTHLDAVFLPVWAFLDGVSRRQEWGHTRKGGKGTNMVSICAGRSLTPHLSNIYFVNFVR